jgi:hypothetical protein
MGWDTGGMNGEGGRPRSGNREIGASGNRKKPTARHGDTENREGPKVGKSEGSA